jgi:hypothetical protein
MQQLVFGGRGSLAYMDGLGAVVRLGNALGASGSKATGKQAGAAATTSQERSATGLVAPWGPGNDFP